MLQGHYNGPVRKAKRRYANSDTNAYVIQWLRDIVVPPIVFLSFAVLVATLHGPGKVLSATVGVLEAVFLLQTIMEVFKGKWKNVLAGMMFVIVTGVASMGNNVVIVVAAVFCLWCAGMSNLSVRRGRGSMAAMYLTLFLATGSGAAFGEYVRINQFSPFNQFQSMATYMNINPSFDKGGAYRDAGSVYFKEGTHVDISRAIAVKSKDLFCLAPLVRLEAQPEPGGAIPPPASGSVDWWVVGMNCCDPSGELFTCGQTGVSSARAGLRLLRDDVRHFYAMGVAEWTSKYGLPATHPLFFDWVTDPVLEVGAFKVGGWAELLRGSELFAALNVMVAFLGLSIRVMVDLTADKKEEDTFPTY